MISRDSVKSPSLEFDTTKNISSSNDDDNFEFLMMDEMDNLFRKNREKFWINSVSLLSLQCFTRKLEQDTLGGMILFHWVGR